MCAEGACVCSCAEGCSTFELKRIAKGAAARSAAPCLWDAVTGIVVLRVDAQSLIGNEPTGDSACLDWLAASAFAQCKKYQSSQSLVGTAMQKHWGDTVQSTSPAECTL